MNRRDFLKATSLAAMAPSFGLSAQTLSTSSQFRLEAAVIEQALTPYPEYKASSLWTYNGGLPGPELRVRQGELMQAELVNRLPEPTTIHWHGIRLSNGMDGVSMLTQPPVEPGARFQYVFSPPDAGTYWYHSHAKTWQQMARGLYGPLIVEGPDEPVVDHDLVCMIDDWRLNAEGQLDEASFGRLHDWAHGGRLGNWLTVNGESNPQRPVKPGSRVRLRLINAANARIFRLQLAAPAVQYALDGYRTPLTSVQDIELAPAQRVDLIIDLTAEPFPLTEVSTGEPYPACSLVPDAALGTATAAKVTLTDPTPESLPNLDTAKRLPLHMQGGAMGNLTEASLDGVMRPIRELAREYQKVWAFNGVVGNMKNRLADLRLGDTAIIEIWNDTRWPHAMHLHGFHFWVRDPETGTVSASRRDTHLMHAGERAELIFVADNPGLWLLHCHMLEHHAAGMGTVIQVS